MTKPTDIYYSVVRSVNETECSARSCEQNQECFEGFSGISCRCQTGFSDEMILQRDAKDCSIPRQHVNEKISHLIQRCKEINSSYLA